ncbi:LysR substrate-binding domain-containing protein [Marinivivus vitaminiproducens]|uniref:LysR substrate-binding domain-containing protein n=1 Tax=Marinivivus vitaminiproducens TaxID=3035935 RepID=UPI00279B0CFF|nr:LysR substrate-binding domain-containing protein [Geminicoccaceae bacterium SCSIO 64248]
MFAPLPLTALRSFEAAARLGSFKEAAAELAVTPTAVSHQIRQLEAWLGRALFTRLAHGVALTEAGQQLFRRVHSALIELAQATDALKPDRPRGRVTIATTPSFAALWLVPRLGRFYAAHPGIEVRMIGSAELADLQRDASIDLAIRYAVSDTAGLLVHGRLEETFAVYGAPEAGPVGERPALITVRWGGSALYEEAWRAWCAAAGLDWRRDDGSIVAYDEEFHAMQAAVAGQGLVLASSVLISDSVRHGLVRPFRPEVTVQGAAYTILSVPGRERHPPVASFLRWLKGAFAQSAASATPGSRVSTELAGRPAAPGD